MLVTESIRFELADWQSVDVGRSDRVLEVPPVAATGMAPSLQAVYCVYLEKVSEEDESKQQRLKTEAQFTNQV